MTAHHLTICFREDGQIDFFPKTSDPAELALRFGELIRMFLEHPTAVGCAAGFHQGDRRDDG